MSYVYRPHLIPFRLSTSSDLPSAAICSYFVSNKLRISKGLTKPGWSSTSSGLTMVITRRTRCLGGFVDRMHAASLMYILCASLVFMLGLMDVQLTNHSMPTKTTKNETKVPVHVSSEFVHVYLPANSL